jgi:serine/threonine protein kinase
MRQDVGVYRPERIGRYRVSRLLGSGGFASVWLGIDDTLDEPVAIKVLAENWANVPDIHSRFLLEARLLRKADSDRVVRMYDIGELSDDRPYFVMSYADRGTVGNLLGGPRLPEPQALHIAVETARAVAVLHGLGVVHRDIKPSNVLVQTTPGGGERFLIGDLGVAKHVAKASGFTIAAGTPGYMAPEQADRGLDVDVRADVFGLGAFAYHLLTGMKYDAAKVRDLPLAKNLKRVVARALEQDRERRWSDGAAFADALAALLPEVQAGAEPERRKSGPSLFGRRDGERPAADQQHDRERGSSGERSPRVPWPTAARYGEAVQRKEQAFTVPLLRSARFDADPNGVPTWVEGQSAVTFLAETEQGPLAVRCFKRPPRAGMARYHALEAFQRDNPASPLVPAQWHEDAVFVDEHKWPLVTMRHVSGSSLRRFVDAAVERRDPAVLGQLASGWLTLTAELSAAGVAHADLQHDNVRVAEDRRLCLIDLDSVWLPAIAQLPPAERGHRHFQHPERLATGHWDRHVDAFSALVIYVSLRAVAADPELWSFHNDENLIFTDDDYLLPGETNLWHRITSSPDLEVRNLAVLLDQFCRRTVELDTSLQEIVGSSRVPDGPEWTPTEQRESEYAPWWADPVDEVRERPLPETDWWQDDRTDRMAPVEASTPVLSLSDLSGERPRDNGLAADSGASLARPRRWRKILIWSIVVLVFAGGGAAAALFVWGPW